MKANHYWPELDGIRTLAFLLVFISHVGALPEVNLLHPLVTGYNLLVKWGWIGVDLFLVLSGFLITILLLIERKTYGTIALKYFLIRRMLRIWPLYYLVLVLGVLILPAFHWMDIGFYSQAFRIMVETYLLPYIFFLGNIALSVKIIAISPMIVSLWTASMEEQFYLIWGSMLRWISKTMHLIAIIIILLFVAIITRFYLQAHSTSHTPYYYNTITHMDSLLVGSLAAFCWVRFEEIIKSLSNILLALSLIIITSIVIYLPPIFDNQPSIVFAMTTISIAWTFFLLSVLSTPWLQKIFSLRYIAKLGKITYGMYLLHYPILITCLSVSRSHLFAHCSELLKWNFNFFTTLALTVSAAMLSWQYFERPFNLLRKDFSRKNKESQLDLNLKQHDVFGQEQNSLSSLS